MAGKNNYDLEKAESLLSIKNRSFAVQLEIVTENGPAPDRLYVGQSVKIRFRSEKDCYLTLIDMGTSGKAHIIVPSPFDIDNFVRGGRDVYYPEGGWDLAAMIQGPAGTERIKAFATLEPLNLFELDFANLTHESLSFTAGQMDARARKAAAKLSRVSSDSWAEALCEFSISYAEGPGLVR